MNRDMTIVQVAILLIAIGILGAAIYKQQHKEEDITPPKKVVVATPPAASKSSPTVKTGATVTTTSSGSKTTVATNSGDELIERANSARTNFVKQYFAYLQGKEFQKACALLSPAKCAPNRPSAVQSFSTEYEKYANGYEYVMVKDFNIISPSGKDVVCVKYAYRLKSEENPALVSEVLSFYLDEDVGNYRITDRVCEKKYKDGVGVRPCPIQAIQNFCAGKIR